MMNNWRVFAIIACFMWFSTVGVLIWTNRIDPVAVLIILLLPFSFVAGRLVMQWMR